MTRIQVPPTRKCGIIYILVAKPASPCLSYLLHHGQSGRKRLLEKHHQIIPFIRYMLYRRTSYATLSVVLEESMLGVVIIPSESKSASIVN